MDQNRCMDELEWAMRECESLGSQLVTSVLLRNPDIEDRCSKPELFDRYGKLRNDLIITNDYQKSLHNIHS